MSANNLTLADLYFGDLDALEESINGKNYLFKSFISPISFSFSTLKNSSNFIIVGRKGAGKTAAQIYFEKELQERGYLTKSFSFFDDIKAEDYTRLAKTQEIDFVELAKRNNIFLYYDFRGVWMRLFLTKVAEALRAAGFENKFTHFMLGSHSRLSGLFDGITKSATLKIEFDIGFLKAELGIDPSRIIENGEIKINDFNEIAQKLFCLECVPYQMYIFIDELVFSKLDARDDEVTARAAMVRDIVRTCRDLNLLCVKRELNFHFICSIRPEIRNLLSDLDAEIGKILDGRDVLLHWNEASEKDPVIIQVFKQKIINSHYSGINYSDFLDSEISFSGRDTVPIENFLLTNTWWRPRDLVRLLKSIQKVNPSSNRISVSNIKAALNEYSRASMKEITDELSVTYPQSVIGRLKQAISRRQYENFHSFSRELSRYLQGVEIEEFAQALFQYGVIGNVDYTARSKPRYYWFHREEEFLKYDFEVRINPGLWNYFNIRNN